MHNYPWDRWIFVRWRVDVHWSLVIVYGWFMRDDRWLMVDDWWLGDWWLMVDDWWLIGFRHYNLYVSPALILMFIFGTDIHCANGPRRIYRCIFVLLGLCALSRPLQFWLVRRLSLARSQFCMYASISHCFVHHRAMANVSIERIIHIPLTYAYVCTCEPMISRCRVVHIVVPCPYAQSTPQ